MKTASEAAEMDDLVFCRHRADGDLLSFPEIGGPMNYAYGFWFLIGFLVAALMGAIADKSKGDK